MSVFVLGSDGIPVMPCTPKRARLLLERQKARVVRIKPFTIQLKDRAIRIMRHLCLTTIHT